MIAAERPAPSGPEPLPAPERPAPSGPGLLPVPERAAPSGPAGRDGTGRCGAPVPPDPIQAPGPALPQVCPGPAPAWVPAARQSHPRPPGRGGRARGPPPIRGAAPDGPPRPPAGRPQPADPPEPAGPPDQRSQRINRGEPHSGCSQVPVRPWLGTGGQPEQRVTGCDERMRPRAAGARRDRPRGQGQRGLDQAGDAGRRPAVPDAGRDGAQGRDGPAASPEPRQRGQLGQVAGRAPVPAPSSSWTSAGSIPACR